VTGADAVRVRLDQAPSRDTVLDGAWWPRSTDLMAELPKLIETLSGRGEITHALLNAADWDLPHPRRLSAGRKGVRLGFYTSQPAGLVTLMTDFGRDRYDLFVIPPGTDASSAEDALAAASDAGDGRRAPALLAGLTSAQPQTA
jgi:hypothetical protein